MAAMDELAAWLTQIWDEIESVVSQPNVARLVAPTPDRQALAEYAVLDDTLHASATYVLARIAADRQILELHTGEHQCQEIHTGTYAADWLVDASYGEPGGTWRHASSEHFDDEPCPTQLLLALPHADRPGYREEWRP